MKQILTVFSFTFRDGIRKKAFIISTIIMLAFVAIACSIPAITQFFSGNDREESVAESAENTQGEEASNHGTADHTEVSATGNGQTCFYLDETGILEGGLEALQAEFPNYSMMELSASEEAEIRSQIKENDMLSLVKVSEADGVPFLTIVTKDFMSGINADRVVQALNDNYVTLVLSRQGVADEMIQFARSTIPYSTEIEGDMDLTGYIVGILLTLVTFFAIYYYGYGVAMSIATEKTTRVMETLIVSAKPSRILLGKCLGMGVLGLFQFGLILIFAAICYMVMIPEGFLIMGMELSLSSFSVSSAILVLLYFLLGYALYAMLNAVCGASVSKIEDLNSAMMPVTVVTMVSFYLGYFSMIGASDSSIMQKIAMYVPFCSPFALPFKLLNNDVSTATVVISLALLAAAIIIVGFISVRMYSASVLHYGGRLKWKEMKTLQENE